MKTIICIWGSRNRGKTETIRELAKLLVEKYDAKQDVPSTGDFSLEVNANGKRCGLESSGDPDSDLFNRLKKWAKDSCDVIICASRTRGSTVTDVDSIAKKYHYKLIWTTPYTDNDNNPQDQQRLNSLKAKHLSDLLLEMGLFP
jgi:hypothetical protein